jgi:hypothetical protein
LPAVSWLAYTVDRLGTFEAGPVSNSVTDAITWILEATQLTVHIKPA